MASSSEISELIESDHVLGLIAAVERTQQMLSDCDLNGKLHNGGKQRRDLVKQFKFYDQACISVFVNPPSNLPSDFDLKEFLVTFLRNKAENLGILIDDKQQE